MRGELQISVENQQFATHTFHPTDTTLQSGSLMIFDNVTGSPQIVGLSGTGDAAKKK